MNKPIIKEVIIVEGKTDAQKIDQLVNAQIITTNGSEINKKTLALIKQAQLSKGIILFLDPDYQGERIRKIITNYLKDGMIKQCFISKDNMKDNSKKIGIAEANNDALLKALKSQATFIIDSIESITWLEYLSLNLNNKRIRLILCDYLNISYCNHKQLFKRLNMMQKTFKQIKMIIKGF
ncbi:ribonuclease M5 [Ureaplasma parvum]|uniref:ribonuclease M5 n=1 Tax=Ureaplasma parvum TaxID=134821 RepID=UPI0026EFE12C|nr:ribonuclease M5 [Ureaplasma parvum]